MLERPDTALPADPYGGSSLVWRLLSDFGARYRSRYMVAFVLMAIAAGCTAGAAYVIGDVLNSIFADKDMSRLVLLAGVIMALFAAKGFATYGHAVIIASIGNRVIAENQRRMFSRLLDQRMDFFAARHSSEFLARLNAGAAAASQVLSLVITAAGRDFLSLLGLAGVMIYQQPTLSLVGLVVVPPAILLLRKLIRRARSVAHSQFVGGTRILETLQEALSGMRIIKAFTLEDTMRRRVAENVEEIERASNKMARVANRSSPLMEMLGGFAIALVMIYGGHRVIVSGETPGAFFSFITAFLLAYEPAKRLARLNIDLSAALVGVRMLFEVIDHPPSEPTEDTRPALALKDARVEFSGVHFAFRPDEPVIRGLSFAAEPERLTALVGPSGGGKSTIISLILGLYDVDQGTISIDGQDIANVSRHSLRSQIAYVGQDVFLFRGSIRDNIAFGRPGASQAQIVAAAQAAFAHDFIMSFPEGYDTQVGERGLALSGGERQRIAIARGLIKDAPIILLDEATASLDSESERQVQSAIARLCENRTTLIIAHRLHTIVHADRILVIEDGRVVEQGRHEDLLHRGGRYASFYRLQLQRQHEDAPSIAAQG